ncbi:MAG: hypothetical protein LBG81_01810, partial [Coriobacteriaceae bacterium]|nr:hypothetical protein [Coriobacteriaceae bacterium]
MIGENDIPCFLAIISLEYIALFFTVTLFLGVIFQGKRPSILHSALSALAMAALFVPFQAFAYFEALSMFSVARLPIAILVLFVYLRLFMPGNVPYQLFWAFSIVLTTTVVTLLAWMGVLFFMNPLGLEKTQLQAIVSSLTVASMAVISFFTSKRYYVSEFMFPKLTAVMLLTDVVCIGIFMFLMRDATYPQFMLEQFLSGASYSSLLFLMLIYSNMAVIYILMLDSSEAFKRSELENRYYHMERQTMTLFDGTYAELRGLRHDMRNHAIAVKMFLDKNDNDGLRKYIASFNDMTDDKPLLIQCGNHVVDVLLNTKFAIAQSLGIDAHARLELPDDLVLDEVETVSLLGNLLDNSIEASERWSKAAAQNKGHQEAPALEALQAAEDLPSVEPVAAPASTPDASHAAEPVAAPAPIEALH